MSNYISYGIDLGTTNSCIATFNGDRAQVFQNNDQMSVTPSVVRMEKNGRVIVGRRAYATKMANPANVASEFKRWMGQRDKYIFQAAAKELSAEELSAEVLKALLEDVRSQTSSVVDAAVITVPAAFGQLQCEATARAASLAGLKESVLLQEPIAAAIAYGIAPDSRDQRWLVFDFGGGTFDVAVISSRDGRLTVLDHKGNNHLGGKDIDRAIVERLLMPALEEEFALPSKSDDPSLLYSLMQRLHLKAEEAKIDLSRNDKVIVSLFDLGKDQEGNVIEGEVTITREELEDLCSPIIDKCISLCEDAIIGARTNEGNLDRILLVGGPTQMPFIRRKLQERFNTKLEHSLDSMTVVAQGAAIHAASIEKSSQQAKDKQSDTPGVISITMAFEPVSATLQCPVEGRVESSKKISLKFDAESGHWTSGWFLPEDDTFEVLVSLLENKSTKFWIYARDEQGRTQDTMPDSFTIRHGLMMSAPPLPHTISTELVKADGTTELEPMFKRGTPLPNEVTKTFRANKTLRPSEPDAIAIKLWEGEALTDPEANDLVGNLLIESQKLERPLAEGSEIELTINIDTSRRMSVVAFVQKLNAHFTDDVYVPQRDEEHYAELAQSVPQQLKSHFERLSQLEESLDEGDVQAVEQVQRVRQQLEDLDLEVDAATSDSASNDPDRAKRMVAESKNIRANLGKLENKVVSSASSNLLLREIEQVLPLAEKMVDACGTIIEKKEFALLRREVDRAIQKDDERALRKAAEALNSFYYRTLFKQDWFWSEAFTGLKSDTKNYTNRTAANQLITKGDEALRGGDVQGLKRVVQELFKLLPKEEAEIDRDRAMQAGIRRL